MNLSIKKEEQNFTDHDFHTTTRFRLAREFSSIRTFGLRSSYPHFHLGYGKSVMDTFVKYSSRGGSACQMDYCDEGK